MEDDNVDCAIWVDPDMLAVIIGNGTGSTVVISWRTDVIMTDPPLVPLGATRMTVSTHDQNDVSAGADIVGGDGGTVGDAPKGSSIVAVGSPSGCDVGVVRGGSLEIMLFAAFENGGCCLPAISVSSPILWQNKYVAYLLFLDPYPRFHT
jgi:hypothetical protein